MEQKTQWNKRNHTHLLIDKWQFERRYFHNEVQTIAIQNTERTTDSWKNAKTQWGQKWTGDLNEQFVYSERPASTHGYWGNADEHSRCDFSPEWYHVAWIVNVHKGKWLSHMLLRESVNCHNPFRKHLALSNKMGNAYIY